MARTLLLRRGALGDTVLCVPLLRALHAARPGVPIDCAGHGDFVPLLERYGVVDRAFSSEALALWAHDGAAAAGRHERLARYDLVIADTPAPSTDFGGRWIEFDPRLDGPSREPAWLQLAARVRACFPTMDEPEGPPSLRAARLPPPASAPVVLHPGSGSPRKCWPLRCWLELAAALVDRGQPPAIVLGPAEESLRWPGDGEVHRPRDVLALAAHLEAAAAFVGHDSGVTHLVAALQVPTVAVFGPTDPVVWAPGGDHVRVLGGCLAGPPDATVAEVLAAVAR